MALRRRSALLIALLLTLSLIAAACGGSDDGDGEGVGGEGAGESELEPVEGGTLTFGAEQEPAEGLNGDLACCTLFWQSVIFNRVLLNVYEPESRVRVRADGDAGRRGRGPGGTLSS